MLKKEVIKKADNSVGDLIKVEFASAVFATKPKKAKMVIMAVREDGAFLLRVDNLWGLGLEVKKLIYKEKFENDIVAYCTKSCEREFMALKFGSASGFFRHIGFPHYTA